VVVWRLKGLGWVGWKVEEVEELRVERKVEVERLEVAETRRVEELRGLEEMEEERDLVGLETVRALFLSFDGMMVGGPRGIAGGRLEDRTTVCCRGRRAEEEEEEVEVVPAGRAVVGKAEALAGWL